MAATVRVPLSPSKPSFANEDQLRQLQEQLEKKNRDLLTIQKRLKDMEHQR